MAAKAAAQDRPSFFNRLKNFFKGVWGELKKVHWPDKKQLAKYTGVVVATVIGAAILLFIMDTAITFVFNWLF